MTKYPVTVTLDAGLLERIDRRAVVEERSRSRLIALLLETALMPGPHHIPPFTMPGRPDNSTDKPSPEIASPQVTTPEKAAPNGHTHAKHQVIAGGLHRCSCGSIRGKDGTWS